MNLQEFFKEHNVEFRRHGEHSHCTYGRINTDCPQCSPNTGWFRLGWTLSGKYANSCSCWTCGRLPSFEMLASLTHLNYSEIKKAIGELEPGDEKYPERLPGKLKLPSNLGPLGSVHRKYLRARGFKDPDELVKLWKIQGLDYRNPLLCWRIFIPIIYGGETVSWATRAISKDVPKRYIRASKDQEKFPASELVYGIDFCVHTIIVVEGYLDAWKIGPGAGALMGLKYSRSQLLAISRFPNRYICLDRDVPGQTAAQHLCADLMCFPGSTKNIILESSKDAGDCSDEELKQLQDLL